MSQTSKNIAKAEAILLQLLSAIKSNTDPAKMLLHLYVAMSVSPFRDVCLLGFGHPIQEDLSFCFVG